jgi:hypothetical protein
VEEQKPKISCPLVSVRLPSGTRMVPKMTLGPDGKFVISNPGLRKVLEEMSGKSGEIPEKPPGDQEDQESTDR